MWPSLGNERKKCRKKSKWKQLNFLRNRDSHKCEHCTWICVCVCVTHSAISIFKWRYTNCTHSICSVEKSPLIFEFSKTLVNRFCWFWNVQKTATKPQSTKFPDMVYYGRPYTNTLLFFLFLFFNNRPLLLCVCFCCCFIWMNIGQHRISPLIAS